MKKILWTIFIGLIVLAGSGLIYLYSGAYDIGTSNHDNAFVNWILETGMDRSVEHHSKNIQVPPLDNPAMVKMGFAHYNEMCVSCHGAPGVDPDEIAEGLWPQAPDLAKSTKGEKPGELFWVIKNGVKFTAMPAWGPSHSDQKIWAMVAFLKQLPSMSAADYKKRQAQQSQDDPGGSNE